MIVTDWAWSKHSCSGPTLDGNCNSLQQEMVGMKITRLDFKVDTSFAEKFIGIWSKHSSGLNANRHKMMSSLYTCILPLSSSDIQPC